MTQPVDEYSELSYTLAFLGRMIVLTVPCALIWALRPDNLVLKSLLGAAVLIAACFPITLGVLAAASLRNMIVRRLSMQGARLAVHVTSTLAMLWTLSMMGLVFWAVLQLAG